MRRLALLRMAWITLHRDRLGLALYAIVPIVSPRTKARLYARWYR